MTNMKSFLIILAAVLLGILILFARGAGQTDTAPAHNVSMENGTQIVEIRAKGGFSPRKSTAKAGVPTIVRFETSGTFDCSSSIRIPSLGVNRIIPQSGSTDIDIGTGQVGTLQGTCGMGMFPFEIDFL